MGKRVLYHGTSPKNVESIKKEGLSRFFEGVYLTDSAESAARWTGMKVAFTGYDQVAVIRVIVDEDKLSPGIDHSPLMVQIFGVGESLLHYGAIEPDSILNVIYFQINKK